MHRVLLSGRQLGHFCRIMCNADKKSHQDLCDLQFRETKCYLGVQIKVKVQLRSSAPIAGVTEPGAAPATKKLGGQKNGAREKWGSGGLPQKNF